MIDNHEKPSLEDVYKQSLDIELKSQNDILMKCDTVYSSLLDLKLTNQNVTKCEMIYLTK